LTQKLAAESKRKPEHAVGPKKNEGEDHRNKRGKSHEAKKGGTEEGEKKTKSSPKGRYQKGKNSTSR